MAREPLMVVVDDPNEGFVVVPSEVAQKAGYAQLLGIKPEQVPKDPDKRAAMTALYRERKAARIAREEAANKALEEQNKPFLAEQARRAEASMAEAAAPKLAKVPAVKALQNIQRFSEGPAPTPEPQIDVAPVGRMDAPAMPQNLATAPKMPTAPAVMAEEVPDWAQGFSTASTRAPDDEGRALLALAKSQGGAPAGARASAFAPSAEGIRSTSVPQAYAPAPMASASNAPNAEDEALLKELRDAQRSDGYSSGMRALGDQFRDAMNLILNIQGPKSNMAGTDGGYVSAAKARQALLAAQAKARRDERMTDATVDDRGRDALKDAAALEAAQKKAEKTAQDAATAASLNDPSSPESGRIRETVTQLLGQRVDPATLAKLSGAELKDVALKYGVSLTNAEQNAGLRALQIQQTGENADDAEAIRREMLGIQRQELELARQRLQQQQDQFNDTLKDKDQARADAREDKTQAHNEKMAQLNVGGFAFDAKNPPSTAGAKTMAEVSVARDEVMGSLNKLEGLYRKHGPTMTGAVAGQMETEWMNVTNRLRTVNEMGVPNGADYLMLAKQLQDPTGLRAKFTSDARSMAQFGNLREQVKRKVEATAKAYKYTPASAAPPPDLDLSTEVKEPPVPGAAPAKAAGQPSRADRKFDPTKKEASRTYSADGKWLRIVYEDGTFGLGPSDRKK